MAELEDLLAQAETSTGNHQEHKKQKLEFLNGYSNISYKPLEPYVNHFYELFISRPGVPLECVLDETLDKVIAGKLGHDPKLLGELDLEHDDYMHFIRRFKKLLSLNPFYDPQIDEDTLKAVCLTMNQKIYALPFVEFILPFVGVVIAFHKWHQYLREMTTAYDKYHKLPKIEESYDFKPDFSINPIEPGYYRFRYLLRSFLFTRKIMLQHLDKSMTELLEIAKAQNYQLNIE